MKYFLAILISISSLTIKAQVPSAVPSSEILSKMHKLNRVSSVLYVAAHPDDENTRLISYLSNIEHVKTTYLSLTRGDGGQNMIGTHIQEDLGIIRTQELLAARRIDKGHQMFTRAIDFGYSKTSDESLKIWDKDEVLGDVVWAIRKTRPDIIITRFHHEDKRTHGHHRASAILAIEAFKLAGNPNAYPEQLKYVEPWQAQKILYNTSWWRYGSKEKFSKIDKSQMVSVDVGAYQPLTGESMAETAARSRSQHKSQGFGSSGARGSSLEYLELIEDVKIPSDTSMVIDLKEYTEKIKITRSLPSNYSLFSGINTSWSRFEDGKQIDFLTQQLIENFNPINPSQSVNALLQIRNLISEIDNEYWKNIKLEQIDDIISDCLGLYISAFSDRIYYTPNDSVFVDVKITNRSDYPIKLTRIENIHTSESFDLDEILKNNISYTFNDRFKLNNLSLSTPYWLRDAGNQGLYKVASQEDVGMPENEDLLRYKVEISLNNTTIDLNVPVIEQHTDRVRGEVRTPIISVPKLVVLPTKDFYLFKNGNRAEINIRLKSYADNIDELVTLSILNDSYWEIERSEQHVQIGKKGGEQVLSFSINPPEQTSDVKAVLKDSEGNTLNVLTIIDYEHIPLQSKIKETSIRFVNVQVKTKGEKIGYLMGPGDKVPDAIRQLGYTLDMLEDSDIKAENLNQYDAIVVGIRAYNTLDRMNVYQPILLNYVKEGGVLIVQYNTTWGLDIENVGPYPITFSRLRVTQEDAPVNIIAYNHPVMNTPNEISSKDFDHWVQERGLYFASDWDERYTPILSSHDDGEKDLQGGMLVTKYGSGYYVYTGYSWFRELPAGVPGAYRIFANMLSLGYAE